MVEMHVALSWERSQHQVDCIVVSIEHTGYECAGLQAYVIEDVVGTGV